MNWNYRKEKSLERRRYLGNTDYNPAGLLLISERRKYKMLLDAKIACYSEWVRDCRGDTKELYKLVNTLMGTTSKNTLPNHTNDKDLADEFADFFMNKIQRIRDNLTGKSWYANLHEKIYLR